MPYIFREVSSTASIITAYFTTYKRKTTGCLSHMFCKWACTVLMYLAFGSIPHKVNMTAKTTVSQGTSATVSAWGWGVVLGNAKWAQFVAGAISLSNGNYLVLCTRLSCGFPPWNHSLIMEASPSIFICQPDSTTQVGSTFVFLVVTMSPGSHVPPVLFPGWKWLQGSGNGGSYFASRFSVRVWWHISLQLQLSLHRDQAGNFTAKLIDEWLSGENPLGCFLEKVNFLKLRTLYFMFM